MRLRHARLRDEPGDRKHVLLVYDEQDNLICWCGPYTAPEAYEHSLAWGAVGWSWAQGKVPQDLRPERPARIKSRLSIAEALATKRTIRGTMPAFDALAY